MKKMMIVALMAVVASTAFAGDSEALKSILKAKTYAEAESLVKSSLGQLADATEKARAYNKLVDLAMAKVLEVQAVMNSNQVAEQMKQGKVVPYDTLGFYTALAQAFNAASECEKYDLMPNEKGKVKAKFHDANRDRLYSLRGNLINGGITYQDKGDMKTAYQYLAQYVDTHDDPLFAEAAAKTPDENLSQIAYYAALFAYQNKDMKNVPRYADIAAKEEKFATDANNLKLAAQQDGLKTREDSLAYVKTLVADYAADPKNEVVFGTLVNMYSNLKMDTEMNALFDKKLATDPDNFTVWAVRGQNAMIAQKLDDAVNCFKKALVQQPDNAQILTYLGACLLDRGAEAENRAAGKTGRVPKEAMDQIIPIFEEALVHLTKAKNLDPTREKANWAYPLYRCCYQLYGAEDARTKAAEADTQ